MWPNGLPYTSKPIYTMIFQVQERGIAMVLLGRQGPSQGGGGLYACWLSRGVCAGGKLFQWNTLHRNTHTQNN